jgi:recombination protein RecR
MQTTPEPIARLIGEFSRLPGIGPKSASRLTFYLLRNSREQAEALSAAITDVKDKITFCTVCHNVTEDDPCAICADPGRDRGKICVVE